MTTDVGEDMDLEFRKGGDVAHKTEVGEETESGLEIAEAGAGSGVLEDADVKNEAELEDTLNVDAGTEVVGDPARRIIRTSETSRVFEGVRP